MIGCLRGNILEKNPPLVLIETHGVGYEVYMPINCFAELPKINQEIIIFIQFIIRDGTQLLFGFNNKQERALFRELIKVKGVGHKMALSILSNISIQQFVKVIENENIEFIIKLPGIGQKTAERLMIEMKDFLKNKHSDLFNEDLKSKININPIKKSNDTKSEAISALVSLGFSLHEANLMITKVKNPNADCQTLIREALRMLN